MINNVNRKLELLTQSVWSIKDIVEYYGCSRAKAGRVKNKAMTEKNGTTPYGEKYVLVDSVLEIYGTSRKQEIDVLRRFNDNEN